MEKSEKTRIQFMGIDKSTSFTVHNVSVDELSELVKNALFELRKTKEKNIVIFENYKPL